MAAAKQIREEKKVAAERPVVQAGYTDSMAHLRDHLERIALMVKAQTVRWRCTVAADKPENMWGMIHVTDAEVHAFLSSRWNGRGEYPPERQKELTEFGTGLEALTARISDAEAKTADSTLLRLRRLQRAFSLSDHERDILLVGLLPEWDARYRRMYGYLQDDASRTQPTVELVAAILSKDGNGLEAVRACFEEGRPLLAQHLVFLLNRFDETLPLRSMRLEDRITSYLLGSDDVDGKLHGVTELEEPLEWSSLTAEQEQIDRLRNVVHWWQHYPSPNGAALFLRGVYGSGRLASARAVSSALGMPLLSVDSERATRAASSWDEIIFLAFREAVLRGAVLYWASCEALMARDQAPGKWAALIAAAEQFKGLIILASQTTWEPEGHFAEKTFLHLEFGIPGYAVRRRLWKVHMPGHEAFAAPAPDLDALAEALATRFQLTEGQVLDAIRAARSHALFRGSEKPLIAKEDLYEGCRRQSSRRLLTYSRRIEPRQHLSFSDLVLPKANLRQLNEVQNRIRMLQRVHSELGFEDRLRLGRGMVVLFTGASGTGKTMAAEWLAGELGVDLYKADLSSVVSKWVGETEKNLHQLFAEAEDSSAIIFFDEADALFGKRGEVKDARDRWANSEVNYLLQRIEEYAGVVILASNLRQNIDEAFLRRISAMVEFPAPDDAARAQIWQGMFPPGLKRPSDDELQSLAARIKLPGGCVRNIVVDAAFRAASAAEGKEPVVTLQHLVLASAREYQKLGKPLTRTEFGDVFFRWVEEEVL